MIDFVVIGDRVTYSGLIQLCYSPLDENLNSSHGLSDWHTDWLVLKVSWPTLPVFTWSYDLSVITDDGALNAEKLQISSWAGDVVSVLTIKWHKMTRNTFLEFILCHWNFIIVCKAEDEYTWKQHGKGGSIWIFLFN